MGQARKNTSRVDFAHLARCHDCREAYGALRRLDESLKKNVRTAHRPDGRSRVDR